MDVYSLEDPDENSLFITQEPKQIIPFAPSFDVGHEVDFEAPKVSQNEGMGDTHYSDISDDDVFEIPSSQVPEVTRSDRCVNFYVYTLKLFRLR